MPCLQCILDESIKSSIERPRFALKWLLVAPSKTDAHQRRRKEHTAQNKTHDADMGLAMFISQPTYEDRAEMMLPGEYKRGYARASLITNLGRAGCNDSDPPG